MTTSSSRAVRRAVPVTAFVLFSVFMMLAPALSPRTDAHVDPACSLSLQDEPVARAGPDQNVTVGSIVTLNGSLSSGFEGPQNLNYTWTIVFNKTTTVLYGMVVKTSFNRTGLAVANLTVRDSLNRTAWDKVNIVVKERPKSFFERYWFELILGGIGAVALVLVAIRVATRLVAGEPVISESGREKFRLSTKKTSKIMRQLMRNPMGALGVIILIVFVFIAIFGPELAPYDVREIHPTEKLQLPSKLHWMGTDNLGVDIFSELLYGARTSIIVGIFSAIIASFLGAAVGLYSGYVGGWKDEVIMRANDVVLSIPWLVLMIVVAALLGKIDLTGIILIIGFTGWSTTARMVRAQVLSVRERQYIERARAIGASELSIIRRHIFPNTFPLIFANTILTVAVSILSEATLSFLGLRPSNTVTWGTMLSFASDSSAFQIGLQWWILAPGLCIVTVVLGFTLLGYALDEILNPKLRRR
jgi:peptide/nickel transport system permease protein